MTSIFTVNISYLFLYNDITLFFTFSRLLMLDRTNAAPGAKGAGVHWDIVLLCAINCLGGYDTL